MWPKQMFADLKKKPHENDAVIFGDILVTFGPDWG